MIKLEDRPLPMFRKGDRVRLVDDRGIAGYRKRNGMTHGKEFVVYKCWRKHIRRKRKHKHLLMLDGHHDWVFSTRRFELVYSNSFDDELFEI